MQLSDWKNITLLPMEVILLLPQTTGNSNLKFLALLFPLAGKCNPISTNRKTTNSLKNLLTRMMKFTFTLTTVQQQTLPINRDCGWFAPGCGHLFYHN